MWNLHRSDRSFVAQFRCGVWQLRDESGRFCNLEPDHRICQLCDIGINDDGICPI